MNMIRIANVLIGLCLLLAGCKNSEKETPSGLKFQVVNEGNGVLPKKDQVVVFDFLMRDSKDSIWNSTYDRGMPGVFLIADSSNIKNEDGMEQMFRMLSKGDSVRIHMPVRKLFADVFKQPLPPFVDSTLDVTYFVKVQEIMSKEDFGTYQTKLIENKRTRQESKDEKIITDYLTKNNIKAERDSSGLHYVLYAGAPKSAQKPTAENCVEVSYKGRFLENGQTFDQNQSASFPLAGVITGWRIGIPKLSVGDSATLFVPSGLAYGAQGIPGAMPPDAILVFDVRLKKVLEFDPATRSCK